MNRTLAGILAAVALTAALSVSGAAAGRPAAEAWPARVAPGVYHLGERIPLEFEVPLTTPAYFLDGDLVPGADWGPDARISAVKQTPPATFPGALRIRVELQAFATGTVALPGLPLVVRSGGQPRSLLVQVAPFAVTPQLPPGASEPPPAAPLPLPSAFPWGALLLAAACVMLVAWAVRWAILRRRARPLEPTVRPGLRETDPDRWIREEILRLFRDSAEPQARYAALSQRLRDYLEIRSGLPFLEWTTGEVLAGLKRLEGLTSNHAVDLMGVLSLCDWAVFARYRPEAREERDAQDRCQRFLVAMTAPPPAREGAA